MFSLLKRSKRVGELSPKTMLYLFNSLIKPIILYGSDVWGARPGGGCAADKVQLWFLRLVLNVKATTSNIITFGECGVIPASLYCLVNCIVYFLRFSNLPETSLHKRAFCELQKLHNLGYVTWYSRVCNLARTNNIDLTIKQNKSTITECIFNIDEVILGLITL